MIDKISAWIENLPKRNSRVFAFFFSGLLIANTITSGFLLHLGTSRLVVYPIGIIFYLISMIGIVVFYETKK